MKILVVDDQPINVLLLEELLDSKYENILTAEGGQEALDIIAKELPDVVLLDILMPEMDGFEVLEKIKENERTRDIAVIMVTAKIEKEDVKKALTMGASDYIKKPIDATELYAKINIQDKLVSEQKKAEKYQTYANIHESMLLAQRLQNALLPDKLEFNKIFPNSFTLYLPKDIVSGDFYYTFKKEGKKFISVFDCTGHGVPGALLTMLSYMEMDKVVRQNEVTDPLQVAHKLRDGLVSQLSKTSDTYVASNGMDATFCEFETSTKILNFVGAHRPLVIIRKNEKKLKVNNELIEPTEEHNEFSLFRIRGDRYSVDIESQKFAFTKNVIQLKEGDAIYMFSDGYIDQFGGEQQKRFSRKKLLELLLENQSNSLSAQKLVLFKIFTDWQEGKEQTDDIVLIGITV